jgi:O-antigen/teichoic acid export membrane protein
VEINSRELKVKTFVSTAWTVVRSGVEQLFTFIGLAILARLLTPKDFGLFTLAAASVELASIFALGGWSEAVYRAKQLDNESADTLFWGALTLATLVALVFAALSVPISRATGQPSLVPMLLALAGSIPLLALGQVHTARKLRIFGHKTMALRAIVAAVLGLAAAVTVALHGGGAWSMVVERYVHLVVGVVLAFAAFPWRPRLRVKLSELRGVLRFNVDITLSSIMNYFTFRFPYLLSGRLIGVEAVAHYRMGSKPLDFVSQSALSPLLTVSLPSLTRLQDDPAGFSNAYVRFVGLSALLTCPVIFGFGAVASDAIPLLFGPQWRTAIPVCQILSTGAAALVAGAFIGSALLAAGAAKPLARLSLLNVATVVLFTLAGIPFGLPGIAAAQVLRLYAMLPIQLHVLRRHTGVTVRSALAPVLPSLMASLVMAAVVMVAHRWTSVRIDVPLLRLAAEVVVGAGAYALCLSTLTRKHLDWQIDGARSVIALWRSGAR